METLYALGAVATIVSGLIALAGVVWKVWRLRRKKKEH
jgi:hypothetical protein